MPLEPAKKISLSRAYSVRTSQAVIQFGVGAIVDFPNQTLMTAAPEYWKEQVVQIHDERLEKLLHVDYFGLPGNQDDKGHGEGVSYARFPEYYFCPKCRTFKPIKEWFDEYKNKATQAQLDRDPYMVKSLRCPTCKSDLVVTRIVTVCDQGHIDDFPWIQWVHCQNINGGPKPVCKHPKLTFKTSASSAEGLEGLTITCESCKARATLKGAFDVNKFEELESKHGNRYRFRCSGRHPWKNSCEVCGKFPRALQRSSSSVYFPITASSLVIPPYSSILTKKVEGSKAFEKQKDSIALLVKNPMTANMVQSFIAASISSFADEIALEIGIEKSKIEPILERKWIENNTEQEYSTTSVKYRAEEYEALSGKIALAAEDYGDFLRESIDIQKYRIPGIKQISLIHKVREVQALIGFSRIKPVEPGIDTEKIKAVSIKEPTTNWYPAYEVRGEGIFIEFDDAAIQRWISSNPEMQKRADNINENYAKTYYGNSRPRKISPKFLLLHTISHLLIKQLSFECGYSIASLKERLYCSDSNDGYVMAGILIYTASGDSEGTMGGLVRQGRQDTFPNIYKKAIESAMVCSNDPVCSLSQGQGRDSLNLSACYSCSLIPETSCEEFNVFLDRGTVVGTYENRSMGFYYKQLYAGEPWRTKIDATTEKENVVENMRQLFVTDVGIDISEESLATIWNSLKEWSKDVNERKLLSDLEISADRFIHCEIPKKDCSFQIAGHPDTYECDLMWINSKVAFFTEDHEEDYQQAKDSDWICYLATDCALTVDKLLSSIRRQ